jgi:murein DD-endopeptidase MepM/ murein hydrolase activator NlpD
LPTKCSYAITLAFFVSLIVVSCPAAAQPAQQCRLSPASVKLGQTIHLHCPAGVASATMGNRTIQMFSQSDGTTLGLMPVPVTQKPGDYPVEFFSADKKSLFTAKAVVLKTYFPSQNVSLTAAIEALHSTPDDIHLLTTFRESVSNDRFWQEPLVAPVPGCMTSPFGVKRLHNGKPTGEFHGGVDQRTPEGEPIRAIAAGKVSFAQKFNVLGNAVGVDHGQGLESTYMHMSKLAVEPGAQVEKGAILGYAGETGRANGPHLHWVMYVNGVNVNAAQWIKLSPCSAPKKHH